MISLSGLRKAALLFTAINWLAGTVALHAQAKPAPAPAPAADPAKTDDLGPLNLDQEMEALYKEAYSSFTEGNYQGALDKIKRIHTRTNNKDFEQVMFLEGACNYMLEKYGEAVTLLQKFVNTFGKSASIADATINLGRALLKKGDSEKGVSVLTKAVTDFPARKGEIGLTIANHHKEKGNLDEARRILENVTALAAMSPEMVQSFLLLAEIYTSQGETEKAASIMEKLKGSSADEDTVIQRNMLGLKIGDEMREKKLYKEALIAYQNVRKQSELLRIQKGRIARMEQWQADAAAGKKVYFLNRPVDKAEIESLLEGNRKILEEIEKHKSLDAEVYFRLGQCFFEMQRFYEALLALNEVYEKYPDYPNRGLALYCMILAQQNLQREGRAYELCTKYMKEFPTGEFITEVSDLLGVLAYRSGRINEAILALRRARDAAKEDADKERINYLLGNVLFEAQKFDDARDAFQTLLKANKASAYKDEAEYRVALTHFFQNDSVKTRKALREYIAGNPDGTYLVDAQYRLAFIESQSSDVAKARETLEKLTVDHPNDQNIGQVWSLLGDIYSRMPNTEKENFSEMAMKAYVAAVDKAKTPDVLEYAIEAASNILTTEGKWPELASMWQTYYSTHKTGSESLRAVYQIATAYRRMGKAEEAQKLMAEHIAPNLGNPSNEQVEVLIQQLAAMLVPKKRPKAPKEPDGKPATGKPEGAKPEQPPQPTLEELSDRLKNLLTGAAGDAGINNSTAQARVLFGRAILARYMKDIPRYESLIAVIPDAAKPEELSPLLLATVGDLLFAKGDIEKASLYFQRLRDAYSSSEFGDKAPVGLGRIEMARKNYQLALNLFNEAIEKYQGSSSLLDATLGKAECLLELGGSDSKKLEEAEKIYKTVAATREWKGEPTANALYHLGAIELKRKEYGKAITYFQRVILAHQKYKKWLAKSYLKCAESQLADSKKDDAVTVLRQMLAREDLQEQPEFKQAQDLLAKTGI